MSNGGWHPGWRRRVALAIGACWGWAVLLGVVPAFGQLDYEVAPINYHTAATDNVVDRLQAKLDKGEVTLKYDRKHGYLKAVLEGLRVPPSSQMLVFSKTSFQAPKINPRRPRAVYFSDDAYIGWVQGGDVVEISVADPEQGAVFYTLNQEPAEHPKFIRDRGQCLSCHESTRTSSVPGHLVRSVFAGRSGQPYFGSGTFTTDHSSPFRERWGGWYVTGSHGKQRHMGNLIASESDQLDTIDMEPGANVADLSELVDTTPYLSKHSDIAALMVMEHQTKMHNLITRANFETRSAQHYDSVLNKALERPANHRSDSAKRRVDAAAEKLVEYMLFADEAELTDPIAGTSQFAAEFSKRGPKDVAGRSLRELDMTTRMMNYPCSYLIYSEPFDNLPDEAKQRVYRRLYDVLSGANDSSRFAHLTVSDRQAIAEILAETKTDLPHYWASLH